MRLDMMCVRPANPKAVVRQQKGATISRTIALNLICLLATTACQSLQTRSYPPSTILADTTQMIVGVTTLAGEQVVFDRRAPESMEGGALLEAVTGARIEDDAIVGTTDGVPRTVPLADVRDLKIEERRFSPGRTTKAVGAVVGAAYLFGIVVFAVSGGY